MNFVNRNGRQIQYCKAAKKLNLLHLPDDLTVMIIGKLTAFEILTSAQFVCRRWRRICKDPLMWRTINMCDIRIRNAVEYKLVEKMCRHAIDRSCGQLEDISIKYFGTDDLLKYIIDSGCHKLRRLRLIQCLNQISDKGLCKMAEKLPLLEELDITLCLNVSSIALEAIGRGCPLLKSLKFNYNRNNNGEEFVIAKNMSNLRHLQLVPTNFNNSGSRAILDGCPHLESLDLHESDIVEVEGILKTRSDAQLVTPIPKPTSKFTSNSNSILSTLLFLFLLLFLLLLGENSGEFDFT
ncbi:putative F-box/LRR-repeat protein 23 [Arachis ipaensis]|uniref:F-box/LRR-repeat protein n=1 Tax=Arachis hypogaea TaxID=3818 RepID=A0A6B9VED4_ARAHY|nr:putative F-box/LRR-repeat protein 23 [Arachis ipaensis]QHN79044.1 Putative F-box/LRR-repeat protein [Arachis hypogaea]